MNLLMKNTIMKNEKIGNSPADFQFLNRKKKIK